MRAFSIFDPHLAPQALAAAEADRLRSLATWAYLVLRPGMEFVRQRSNFILGWQMAAQAGVALDAGASAGAVGSAGMPPLGSWMILPDLTSPATQTVLPSNDALYGAAHVELDLLGPIVITVPANIDERYYSIAIMDAHMNNVAHIGPRWTGNAAGDYLLVPPGWAGDAPVGMPIITSPTVSACLYNRMIVEYSDGDIDRVREWQAGLRLTQLSHWGEPDPVPDDVPTAAFVHPDINTMTSALDYLSIGIAHLRRNPLDAGAQWLSSLVTKAGFQEAVHDDDQLAAVEGGVDQATGMLDATLTTWPRTHGWMVPDARLGLPNPEVLKAAAFQQFQIGSNDIAESAYYFLDTAADGSSLDASEGRSYELTFPDGYQPPHHPGGYWSLTMYGRDSLLVANAIDRYALRPGSPGFIVEADGSLVITMATAPVEGAPAGNWLPAPDGAFRLGLRLYYPTDAAASAEWMPPAVHRVTQ